MNIKLPIKCTAGKNLPGMGFRTFRHCAIDNLGTHLPRRHCFAAVSAFTDRYFKRACRYGCGRRNSCKPCRKYVPHLSWLCARQRYRPCRRAFTGTSALIDRIGSPIVNALYPIPKIALLPLFILWLGIGELSKVTIIALGVFFPVAMNTYSGVKNVDPLLIKVAVSLTPPAG